MATKETIDKVKSLLEGHCYGPLREAAEKWLAVADEKYDIKEKAGKAWDKLGDAADKYADASNKFNEKMDAVSDKIGDKFDELSEKAAPTIDKLSEKAAPVLDKLGDKVGDTFDDAKEKLAEVELIKQLKEGINSVGDLLDTFGSKDAKEKFGEDLAETMKKHAEELKAKGEEFCDCEACRKARSILKDFGEDLKINVEDAKEEAEEKTEE